MGIKRLIKSFCWDEKVDIRDITNPTLSFFFVPQTQCAPLQCLRALKMKYRELSPWTVHLSVDGVGFHCLSEEKAEDDRVCGYLNRTLLDTIILSERATRVVNLKSPRHKVCDILYSPGGKNYTLGTQYIYNNPTPRGPFPWFGALVVFLVLALFISWTR